MEIIEGLNNLKCKVQNSVVTLGGFDGVHLGHARLIQQVVKEAQRLKTTSMVICLDPPARAIFKKNSPCLLTKFKQRRELIGRLNPDVLLHLRFNHEFALLSAEKFVQEILYGKLHIKKIIVGWNFRFGNQRRGSVDTLKKFGKHYEFSVQTINPLELKKNIITSSWIRKLVAQADVEKACHFLGHPFCIQGRVTHGNQRGRKLHFPTANLNYSPRIILPRGVFAVYIKIKAEEKLYPGMCNIGLRPTFAAKSRPVVEINIFDFGENIYGQQIDVFFVEKIREEKKFVNRSLLVTQIEKDYQQAQRILYKIRKTKSETLNKFK